MNAPWTRLSSSARYTRGKLTLREDAWRLPDGQEVVYPILAVGVTVGVLPFVDATRVLLVGQYRHLVGDVSWELPGGGAHAGEDQGERPHELSDQLAIVGHRRTPAVSSQPPSAGMEASIG